MKAQQLANLVAGEHTFSDDHDERVSQLAVLITAVRAMERAGWHEHTGDWDWELTVVMKDGTQYGDVYEPDTDGHTYVYADSFRIDGLNMDEGTACVEASNLTTLIIDQAMPDEREISLNIDDIHSIAITD